MKSTHQTYCPLRVTFAAGRAREEARGSEGEYLKSAREKISHAMTLNTKAVSFTVFCGLEQPSQL